MVHSPFSTTGKGKITTTTTTTTTIIIIIIEKHRQSEPENENWYNTFLRVLSQCTLALPQSFHHHEQIPQSIGFETVRTNTQIKLDII